MYDFLPSPADEREPLLLTAEQVELVNQWYAVDDEGVFIHRRGIIEMAKGWGKSPLAGAIALAELAGPVVFDGWDSEGEPVGRERGKGDVPPLIQIAAVSEEQTDNTYGAIYNMLVANDHRAAKELKIDDGRTRLYLTDRPGELHPVTASAGSREGQRLIFAVLDETHLWTPRNGGVKLAATMRRNVGKMNGRTIETTNAPRLGDKSVAERSESDVKRGFHGILHFARRPRQEPQPDWSDSQLTDGLIAAYGDAHWIDLDRILKEVRDPATDWDDALRFYFNVRTAGAGRAVDPRVWDLLATPQDVALGTLIGLGFDGSISRDATVLRGCTTDGYSFLIRAWVNDGTPDWRVPRLEVHQSLAECFARYNVGRMYCDPPKWESEIDGWAEMYGKEVVLKLDTFVSKRFAPATDRWLTAIREGTHTHDGDELTREHVVSAHLRKARINDADDDGRTRYVLIKGDEGRRIDAAVADVLAYEAAMTIDPDAIAGAPNLW